VVAGDDTVAVVLRESFGVLIHCEKSKGKSQGGAPGEEEEDRREKEVLGSPSTTNSSGDACRRADLRRGI
jgi:hypothetical protein